MRSIDLARCAAAASIALLLSACSSGSGYAPGVATAPDDLAPHAVPACPPAGKVIGMGKATAKIVLARTVAGGPATTVQWQIVFTNLTETEPYPRFVFRRLGACGAGANPRGTVDGGGSYQHQKTCNNGNCTVTETIGVTYRPPKALGRNAFRYDAIRFAPEKPAPGYAPTIGALVLVTKT